MESRVLSARGHNASCCCHNNTPPLHIMGLLTQLRLLLWKNFTLRKRQKLRLVIELVWPLFLFFILVWVRSTNHPTYKGQCHYSNKPMPSAGILPWVQGMVCNIQNPCLSQPTPGEAPGQVNNFNNSILSKALIEVQTLLADPALLSNLKLLSGDINQWTSVLQASNQANGRSIPLRSVLKDNETFSEYLRSNLSVSTQTAQRLMSVRVRLNQLPALSTNSDLRSALCSSTLVDRYLVFNSTNHRQEFLNITCSLTTNQLQQTREAFVQNVDQRNLVPLFPLALNLNPAEASVLLAKTSLHAAPVASQLLKFQTSGLLSDANNLDFRSNPFGSLTQLMCGNSGSNSTNNSRSSTPALSLPTLSTSTLRSNSTHSNSSEFCLNLVNTLKGTPSLRLFWTALRPLLQGRVLYTPDTPFTRRIMEQANSTFDALSKVQLLADAWLENEDEIWKFFQNSSQINTLRTLLQNPVFTAALDQQLSGAKLSSALIGNFLFNGQEKDRPPGMPSFDWRNIFNITSQAARLLKEVMGCFDLDKFEGVSSESLLVQQALKLLDEERFWAGVVFTDLDSGEPSLVRYKIRMDVEDTERTDKIKDRSWSPSARDNPFNDLRYVRGGFVYLQDMLDRGIVRAQTGIRETLGVFVQQMPYPCYVDDAFLRSLSRSLPLYMTLAWIYSVALIVKGVVQEKEARLKETVRMMGLKSSTYWMSWTVSSFIPLSVSALLLTLILKYGKVLRYSDPSVIFVFLLVFCMATVMQCFFISVFFSRANLAAACGGLIYFLLYLPHVLCQAWRDVITFRAKLATSLLSCVAFGYGCENFARYEEQGVGIQWSNIFVSSQEDDPYSFFVSIVMMLVDTLMYWILTWYIENVFPGQYGIPKPWYFPFTSSYWCGTPVGSDTEPDALDALEDQNGYLEKPPTGLKAGVSIRNLVKVYKTGNKLAVDKLSLDFYQDHITSFLGHNGAGKTTTMSILTGLFAPTSGTAYVNGFDIRRDMDTIRKKLGMCPQHNVLFNELTVEEHIYFYARLKGRSSGEVKQEIEQMIKDVGLPHKRKELAKNLSGGMQRKLSVAIAFVGGSSVVILDEPTAGVDPYARRGIWELLLKYKQGRTIILSTHHMDEADILGDRIAIISHGRVCCCGSSLFLKKTYGSGYYLTLVQANQERGARKHQSVNKQQCDDFSLDEGIGSSSLSSEEPTDVADLSALVRRHVPEAVFLEVLGQELVYILPYTGSKDGSFASLFKELDLEKERLGISSYGISDTSLEEIFLKVAEETGVDVESNDKNTLVRDWKRSSRESRTHSISSAMEQKEKESSKCEKKKGRFLNRVEDDQHQSVCLNGKGSSVMSGWPLIRHQFLALFIKRFHHARRSRKGIIAQVVLPAFFVCLSLIFSLIVPPFVEYPSLELQPWMYGKPQNTFYSTDRPTEAAVTSVTRSLLNEPGFGTRCMESNPIPKYPCVPAGATDWSTPAVDPAILKIFQDGNWTMQNPSPDCQCSTPERNIMLPDCQPGAGGLPPPRRTQSTTDTLHNLTSYNMTDFLLKTYAKSGKIRYGGISVGGVNSQVMLNESEIIAAVSDFKALFNSTQSNITDKVFQDLETLLIELGTKDNVKVWFYNQGWHAIASFLNVASNAILRASLPSRLQPKLYGISAFNHPLNLTKQQMSAALMSSSTDVVVSICVIFAMSFIPASFVLFLIQERVSKAKHLQFVSGVNPAGYWVANFTWDMCNYIVPCLIVIIIFLCFQQKSYVSPPNLPALILLLILYGWSITPMMYPASFLFSVPSTAYVVLTCINLFIGINGSVATFVMELFDDPNITRINDIMKQVLLIFPHFCLGRGLIDMAKNQAMATLFSSLGEDRFKDPLGWDMVGKNLFAMAIEGVVMFGFTLLIQYKFCWKPGLVKGLPVSLGQEDEDVARERERVHKGGAENDLLRICDLTKVYTGMPVPAVDRICVGVPAAECFGLLGINGAGKTTTFKMLTGDITASGGEAFLNGYSMRTEMGQVHQNMGYCPQFDAIDDLLTGREHLEFYARLRGVPEQEVASVAEWGIQKLGLVKYSNKSAGTYSGGNKRKLSTAMSLIGCPPVVFLDEPTTGMDPKARRFLWDCILSVIKEGRSVILTSHSMEECEALCTRMAIMVNGQFKCLGSIQHLKNRFGDGYTVIVRVQGGATDLSAVEDFVSRSFPGSVLKEKHHNTLQYQIPYTEGALSHMFNQFSKNQHALGVEDYSVSQTTLDQVFVNFARQQHDAEDGVYENPVDTSDEIQMQRC
ncbi:phospholipid-transporting ATPase ABCA1 isoform X2 [Astyanax mexicanus]|uniref:phospholipid-transporting ATPase ABCA1 isoform X2 n=2 Tax=Astyanax mexicanus TaxID=7994 RepID=UPI0020CB45C2|nr:phospholipid-transporting ATPase ABCA1 isoform X2 [Astyanax mexicanus]